MSLDAVNPLNQTTYGQFHGRNANIQIFITAP